MQSGSVFLLGGLCCVSYDVLRFFSLHMERCLKVLVWPDGACWTPQWLPISLDTAGVVLPHLCLLISCLSPMPTTLPLYVLNSSPHALQCLSPYRCLCRWSYACLDALMALTFNIITSLGFSLPVKVSVGNSWQPDPLLRGHVSTVLCMCFLIMLEKADRI